MGYLDKSFEYKWARRWIEGSIMSYARERITLNMVLGRIRKAINMISREEILAIISEVQKLCRSIPGGESRLQVLKEAVEKL